MAFTLEHTPVKPNHVPEETYAERFPQVCVKVDLEERLGVHAHFWETSDAVGSPSRHTVNVVYRATADEPGIRPDDQHTDHRWLTALEDDPPRAPSPDDASPAATDRHVHPDSGRVVTVLDVRERCDRGEVYDRRGSSTDQWPTVWRRS